MKNYLIEIKKHIKASHVKQAKHLLSGLPERPEAEKREVLEMLALAPDKTAFSLLLFLTQKKNQDPDIHDRVIQLVTDRAHLNFKFVLILYQNATRKIIIQAAPLLRHIFTKETDRELLEATLKTVGMKNIRLLTDDVAEFIFYDDPQLKTQAVRALERLDSPRALKLLQQAAKTEKWDQDILDAIQFLTEKQKETAQPDPHEPAPIEATENSCGYHIACLSSKDILERFEAFNSLTQMGTELCTDLIKTINPDEHDLSINTLNLISRTIPKNSDVYILPVIEDPKSGPDLKFAAYTALAAFPELESAATLIKGISESSMHVRLAAVKAIDKNLSDFVHAEIKNKIESGSKTGLLLAESIVDAHAGHLIEQLISSDTFSFIVSNYMERSAPISVIKSYIDILKKRNLKSSIRKYEYLAGERENRFSRTIIVTSPTDSVLKTYDRLICAAGFSSLSFKSIQDAFEAIVAQRPAAIICDLFLNKINGFDFAKEVRQIYSETEVPVILSSLQNEMDKTIFEKEMAACKANAFHHFPLSVQEIKSWAGRP